MAISEKEFKQMQKEIKELKRRLARVERVRNDERRSAPRKIARTVAPLGVRRKRNENAMALEIARRAGLLAELPPEAKARAAEWRALPEEERKRILDEFYNLKLDKQLSDIIIENRR